MNKTQEDFPNLIDTEVLFANLVYALSHYRDVLFKLQSKSPGSIELYPASCGTKNCKFCPHFRWKIWKGNRGKWSAYNIKEPLRYTRRKDFSPAAREVIKTCVELLKIRNELARAIKNLQTRERNSQQLYEQIIEELHTRLEALCEM